MEYVRQCVQERPEELVYRPSFATNSYDIEGKLSSISAPLYLPKLG